MDCQAARERGRSLVVGLEIKEFILLYIKVHRLFKDSFKQKNVNLVGK